MHQVFVSIGSNIDPEENIEIVKGFLNKLFDCEYSSFYKTNAEGFEGNYFINFVVGFKTNLLASELQKSLKQIEQKMGRTENQKGMSNRVIDLDMILYGDHIFQEDDLDIPSKDIEDYLFVLEPLAEIAGELLHPVSKTPFSELLKQLKSG